MSNKEVLQLPVTPDDDYQKLWNHSSVRKVTRQIMSDLELDNNEECSSERGLNFAQSHIKKLYTALDQARIN